MPRPFAHVRAVLFDYGNTLVEFGPAQMDRHHRELHATLSRLYGPCDPQRLRELRDRQVVAPYSRGFRETTFRAVADELVRELYGREPDDAEHIELEDFRLRSLLEDITADPAAHAVLEALRPRRRLALVSNYPCGRSIRDSLRANRLDRHLEIIVVSGEVGWVKPHPEPFRVALEGLGLPAADCLFVGDNWLADVQGAKRAGMHAVHITQHAPYERFEPQPGDHEPDARIAHLSELPGLLDED